MTGAADHESHEQLRRELAWLKRQIRDNERVWSGFRRIEVRLIGAETPDDILAVLVMELPRVFAKVAAVSLAYVASEDGLTHLLTGRPGHFLTLPAERLAALFPAPHRPRLGACSNVERDLFFPGLRECGSVALAPLVLHGRLVGSLNQASRARHHFSPQDATDLLEHLAAVIAMCLENAVARERLKQDGLIDPLTGVPNRRFFERRLREEIERWARHGQPLACMLADIDHFKSINDRFGHAAGDQTLRQVAAALGRGLRASDVLARYGGDEFILLLPETAATQAMAIAERLREAVAGLASPPEGVDQVSISIGLACLRQGDDETGAAARLLERADAALYQAKAAGRNRVMLATVD